MQMKLEDWFGERNLPAWRSQNGRRSWEELAKQPRLAVKGMLNTLVGFETKTLQQSIEDERAAVHLTQGTPDAREGMLAFLEKREPKFNQSS